MPQVTGAWWRDEALLADVRAKRAAGLSPAALFHVVRQEGYATGTEARFRARLSELGIHGPGYGGAPPGEVAEEAALPVTSDKKVGDFNWRVANRALRSMQALKTESSWSQNEAHFEVDTDEPVFITSLCDLHMGSWGTDYDTLERVTDDLLSVRNLFAYLLGDEEHMAIKMRSVLEVSDNLLQPEMQGDYFESWLDEVAHKVLGATWENHAAMREENQAGRSRSSLTKKRRVVYHNGIGHADVKVGSQVYKFAISHFFRGRSMYNPVHGQMRYMRMEAPDREVVMAGDSHVPALSQYVEGGSVRTVVNGGTAQVNSGYGQRFFSLKTFPIWPGVELDPTEHRVTPYWSVRDWMRATGRG